MRHAIDRRGRTLVVYLVVLLGFGFLISEVAAHSRLVKSELSARAVLDTSPKVQRECRTSIAKVWVVPAEGPQIPLTSHGDSSDPRLLIVALPDNLPAGPVNIGYHVLSVDGHVVDDKLTFTIKKPA